MGFTDHIEEFGGKPVREYDLERGLQDPAGAAYRLRLEWDDWQGGRTVGGSFVARTPRRPSPPAPQTGLLGRLFGSGKPPSQPPPAPAGADAEKDLLVRFLAEPGVEAVTALIFGMWEEPYEVDSSGIVAGLVAGRDRLANLRSLFIGEMLMEENEVSWIKQSDMSPIWAAYPELELFQVRGNDGLSLGGIWHERLKSLIIQSGGLSKTVVQQVAHAELPELEHLELWLGEENYGGDATVEDLEPILKGERFPKLKYLGLRDSEKADEIAEAVADAPILDRIEVLDLSMGNLSDAGAAKLTASSRIRRLRRLDIHHHFVSDEALRRLRDLGIEMDASDSKEEEDFRGETYRYIAVSE